MPRGGRSEILGKVQAFLPMIEKANRELAQKIAKDGPDSVRIDKTLNQRAADTSLSENADSSSGSSSSSRGRSRISDDRDESLGTKKKQKPLIVEIGSKQESEQEESEEDSEVDADGVEGERLVQMEFALGDFDETPIAQAERDMEARRVSSSQEQKQKTSSTEIIYKVGDEDEER